nr:hypothetical protein [Kibdelosporangium sp. MJ126-NF4]CTQ92847.1 hypothetical protein [Kibdelosporangium sp. MJ126-NF4]
MDINDSGVTVGLSTAPSRSHAVKWPTSTSVVELQDLPYATSTGAYGINSYGVIVGYTNIDHKGYATKWSTDGTPHELGTPADHRDCMAVTINDNGVAAGDCFSDAGKRRAVRWTADGYPTVLDTGSVEIESSARKINIWGTVVGTTENGRAARWNTDGVPQPLSHPDGATYSSADSVNDSEEVVGYIHAGQVGAGRWAPNGGWTYLDKLPGAAYPYYSASDINASGAIVGRGWTADRKEVGVLWGASGTVTLLPPLPYARPGTVTIANAINGTGAIAGYSDGKAVHWLGYR